MTGRGPRFLDEHDAGTGAEPGHVTDAPTPDTAIPGLQRGPVLLDALPHGPARLDVGWAPEAVAPPRVRVGAPSWLATGLCLLVASWIVLSVVSFVAGLFGQGLLLGAIGAVLVGAAACNGNYARYGVAQVQFADGTTWSRQQVAAAAITPTVSYTDTTTSVSGTATMSLYTGPIGYLNWQYSWTSTDGVALSTAVPGAFIQTGPSTDAIVISGGQSVVDGGTGPNFLTGSTDLGHPDTFLVDWSGGGTTWSTISNLHHGDTLTLWGFQAGVSTQPAMVTDGTAGYQGATLHSELGGAGTGVNASMTLVGMSAADAQSKLTLSTGNAGGNSYLYVAYTG